jgi:hypothetical protein
MLVVGAALLAAVAGAIFVRWGQPQLGNGSLVGVGDGMTWANDGVEDTRMLVRGRPVATITATFSIRNEGHLPFTVHGLDLDPAEQGNWPAHWLSKQHVTFVPTFPRDGQKATPAREVTLSPDEEATIYWSLDMACQPPLSEHASTEIDTLRFSVSWLGVPTTRELPLKLPITFVGDEGTARPVPSHDCTGE